MPEQDKTIVVDGLLLQVQPPIAVAQPSFERRVISWAFTIGTAAFVLALYAAIIYHFLRWAIL